VKIIGVAKIEDMIGVGPVLIVPTTANLKVLSVYASSIVREEKWLAQS